jgi:hypothetical protein
MKVMGNMCQIPHILGANIGFLTDGVAHVMCTGVNNKSGGTVNIEF